LSFRFVFPPPTTIVSCPATEFPIFLFYFLPFARNSCGGGGAVASKETNKKICLFIFFRVVAPSSSLSRTLTADLAFPSLSLRVLGNLDFFFLFIL
jgi:hypothetical protein